MGFSAERWSSFLAAEMGRTVRVRFGRARHNVVVARPGKGALDVRLNAGFAEAPAEVRTALARWLRSGRRARRACSVLDEWIETHLTLPQGPEARQQARIHDPRGEHHDLEELGRELREQEIGEDTLSAERWPELAWGSRRRTRARRSLHLGSYEPDLGLVRIHAVLDQAAVPRFFVRYVLFHELLHAAVPARRGRGGRRVFHGPEFARRERAYPDYERAIAWQDENVERLIRSARTGKSMSARVRRRSARETLRAVQRLLF